MIIRYETQVILIYIHKKNLDCDDCSGFILISCLCCIMSTERLLISVRPRICCSPYRLELSAYKLPHFHYVSQLQEWASAAKRKKRQGSNDQTQTQTHSTLCALSTHPSRPLLGAAKSRLKSKGHKAHRLNYSKRFG